MRAAKKPTATTDHTLPFLESSTDDSVGFLLAVQDVINRKMNGAGQEISVILNYSGAPGGYVDLPAAAHAGPSPDRPRRPSFSA